MMPEHTTPLPVSQMMCANIDYDTHKGRIAIGRVVNGTIRVGQPIVICSSLEPGVARPAKVGGGGGWGRVITKLGVWGGGGGGGG